MDQRGKSHRIVHRFGAYPNGVPATSASETDARVLQVLRAGAHMTAVEIGETVHLDRLAVRHALDRLRKTGRVRLVGRTTRARFWGEGGVGAVWEAAAEATPARGA